MKHLRKSILTLLALTLFGGAGAWAQGPTQVTQITTDMIASWENDNSDVTLADMQALGFGAVDVSVAQAWTAPLGEFVVLIYGFDGTYFNYIAFDHGNPYTPSQTGYTKRGFYGNVAPNGGDVKHFLTGSPAIELTKKGANQWTLGQTPDYDLELQVEYYQKYALKEIPAGWTVMVNGQDSTSRIVEGSLLITETDTVTLVPPAELKNAIKSVTLSDELQTVHIGGLIDVTVYYMPGDTWEDAIARPENTGFEWDDNGDIGCNGKYIFKDGDWVNKSHSIDPNANYEAELI